MYRPADERDGDRNPTRNSRRTAAWRYVFSYVLAHSSSALKVVMAKGQKVSAGPPSSAAAASLADDCMTTSWMRSIAGFALVFDRG